MLLHIFGATSKNGEDLKRAQNQQRDGGTKGRSLEYAGNQMKTRTWSAGNENGGKKRAKVFKVR
jgi:hypothetical protein